jgi:hypothetical protein
VIASNLISRDPIVDCLRATDVLRFTGPKRVAAVYKGVRRDKTFATREHSTPVPASTSR